ncbi:MAG: DegT/DnrJ/EryC1/StrS family aminotransferase, partial [Bacteroidota bacterium]|nr:DegT/DnrJ/EryC1/StrS family aminotransferase [Bacteroidota bacterium]
MGISTRRGIMTIHREQPYMEKYSGISLPVSEDACDKSILIPLYIPMRVEDHDYVIKSLRNLLSK